MVRNCLQCLQLKRAPTKQIKTPLQPVSSLQSYPGDMLQIDLVGPLKSPMYTYVLTAVDVFSKYLFAMPLTNGRADNVARALTTIFFQHSYMPSKILSDLGTAVVSEIMHELTRMLEIRLEHASLKHPQTVDVVERSHSALKRILKLNTNEQWNDWHKYVSLATFIHNTSYHFAIGCSPTVLFHGREPIKPLDVRFGNTTLERLEPTNEYVQTLQDAMLKKFDETKQRLTIMYNKNRAYYDYKADAQPLPKFSYCLLLNPKLMTQSDFSSEFLPIWLPLYRVESVLTNSNYIIRKVGTNFTQCVHRIRLRTVSPQYQVDDLSDIIPDDFRRDPHLGRFRGEPQLFDEAIPSLLDPPPQEMPGLSEEPDIPPITVGLTFPLPMAPAPVILVAPLPPVSGHVVVPPDPVIPEGPVPLASPRATPPDTSDDSSHEEAGPTQSDQNEVPPRPAPNEFILRQTEPYIQKSVRTN